MADITLSNGVKMPLQGFGVFQMRDAEVCKSSILAALKTGYRMIDTAACYANERFVGEAIRESGIDRKELFIVSKVWVQDAGYEKTKKSFQKTLDNMGLDYLDLYLVHMPYGDYHGSWRAMEELYKEGKIKAIGVSNFLADRLIDLALCHEIPPMVNQMETHPFSQWKDLREVMKEFNVAPMAWSPFAEGNNNLFTNETLTAIGARYGKSAAQVVLRWLLQEGIIAIPKSVHEERIQQNFDINDFELTEDEMNVVRAMDENKQFILDITAPERAKRAHAVKFEQ